MSMPLAAAPITDADGQWGDGEPRIGGGYSQNALQEEWEVVDKREQDHTDDQGEHAVSGKDLIFEEFEWQDWLCREAFPDDK